MKTGIIFSLLVLLILILSDYFSINNHIKKEIDVIQVFDIDGHRIVIDKNSVDFSDFHGTVFGYWNEARDTFFHKLIIPKK